MNKCPCGSNQSFVECCEPYLKGSVKAPTAEKLMRARYTAFSTANVDYIETTTDPSARSTFDRSGTEAWAKQSEWLGLQIVSKDLGEEKDSQGIVEFIARYKVEGVEHNHHERSQFKKRNGEWFFLDGRLVQEPVRVADKTGRNDPCPCGSGKKYKKCCGTAA